MKKPTHLNPILAVTLVLILAALEYRPALLALAHEVLLLSKAASLIMLYCVLMGTFVAAIAIALFGATGSHRY